MPITSCHAVYQDGARCDRTVKGGDAYCLRHRQQRKDGVSFTPHIVVQSRRRKVLHRTRV